MHSQQDISHTHFDEIEIKTEDELNSSCDIISKNVDIDQLNLKEQQKKRYDQDTRHRGVLAKWVMFVVSIWLFLVMALLFTNCFLSERLDTAIIIALLTTTTINILGLPLIILRNLFRN